VTAFIAQVLSLLGQLLIAGDGPDEAGIAEVREQEGGDVGPGGRAADLVAAQEAGPDADFDRRVDRAGEARDRPLRVAVDHDRRRDELFAGLTDTQRAQLRGLLLVLGRKAA
jgi:hypothetical protein